ncbi:hypothetical protein THAR02_04564 [Trichoderma harzianum]|uniref:Mmc protein n=1 Tax=Trichoderma harzianum TaxID=5544 RepID=A0A0F9XTB0_TRIHA|nr:hypothetical protein THAR02_04564 [Trichoderma harzianum]
MKFTAAVALAAVGVSAVYVPPSNVTVVTDVVDQYVTYCPYATQITHGSKTYTVTEPTTLTITDCPCTITRPVTVTSSVVCNTCGNAAPTGAPSGGNGGGYTPPAFTNSTITTPTQAPPPSGPASTGGVVPTAPPAVPTGGASKAVLSGAGLAGIVGLAAFVL